MLEKPLGIRAYGHIPHLPGSKLGRGDHMISEGQAKICLEKGRDKKDQIFIEVKLDGSNVAVAKIDGNCVALTRSGYLAVSSVYRQHILFNQYVINHYAKFDSLLQEGERVVGEWLALAHGTRYHLLQDPFVALDLMTKHDRILRKDFWARCMQYDITFPHLMALSPRSTEWVSRELIKLEGIHGELDPLEGAVWRIERENRVDFLAKWVRPDFEAGKFLSQDVWNTGLERWGFHERTM